MFLFAIFFLPFFRIPRRIRGIESHAHGPYRIVSRTTAWEKKRKLNGGNPGPPISAEKAGIDLRKIFADLGLPYPRLHDCPLENPAMRLVDVPCIFANFHADADDPRN